MWDVSPSYGLLVVGGADRSVASQAGRSLELDCLLGGDGVGNFLGFFQPCSCGGLRCRRLRAPNGIGQWVLRDFQCSCRRELLGRGARLSTSVHCKPSTFAFPFLVRML
jgi:hypothetical protein